MTTLLTASTVTFVALFVLVTLLVTTLVSSIRQRYTNTKKKYVYYTPKYDTLYVLDKKLKSTKSRTYIAEL